MLIGISLTGLIITSGFILSDFIFPNGIFTNYPKRDNYNWEVDYHNFTTNDTNIMGIRIWFREYNSSFLNHSSPTLSGISTTRSAAMKHDWMGEYNNYSAVLNDSFWAVSVFGGTNYNNFNVADAQKSYNVNHSDPYYFFIEDLFIAYEVDQFAGKILSAINNSRLLQENESSYPDLDNVSENYIVNIDIEFEDFSSIDIEVHNDGWMRVTHMKCSSFGREECEEYPPGLKTCESGTQVGVDEFREIGPNLNDFYTLFSSYLNNHIFADF